MAQLTVGDRDWRIVWRPITDEESTPVIEVAEVWAVGACSDSEVYEEMAERVASLPDSLRTVGLAEVIDQFAKLRAGIVAASPPAKEDLPDWLIERLVHTAGLQGDVVESMTLQKAVDTWTAWTSKPR